jgi:orotidine-5'-phosphate decarboxylase
VKIVVALDGMDFEKAFGMYVQLAPHCDGFKINHTLLEHSSMFANYEGEVMVDLKLWDTPNSVCSVVEKILETPATMCTVSTFNNSEVFKCLHQYSEDIKLLGVTYLTSWSEKEQFEIARETKVDMWERHLKRIRKYGFAGIVCSAHDISDMKDDSILRICPGITFQSSNSGQVRTVSPRAAQGFGADYAIIGRSITKANHPVKTIEAIKYSLICYNAK